jgi:hypothetical protein
MKWSHTGRTSAEEGVLVVSKLHYWTTECKDPVPGVELLSTK